MTTPDPDLMPSLKRWVDDAVRRQVGVCLHEIFERAARELYAPAPHSSSLAGAGFIADGEAPPVDEIRQPAAQLTGLSMPAAQIVTAGYSDAVLDLLEHAAEAIAAAAALEPQKPAVGLGALENGLPSTVAELRKQSLSTAEVAARLGVNPSRIRQRLLARTLYGFKDSAGWWLPEFQFDEGATVPGVEQIFPEIEPSVSPVAVARWFVTPWMDLVVDEEREIVVSPRTWLLEGRDPALVAAQAQVL